MSERPRAGGYARRKQNKLRQEQAALGRLRLAIQPAAFTTTPTPFASSYGYDAKILRAPGHSVIRASRRPPSHSRWAIAAQRCY